MKLNWGRLGGGMRLQEVMQPAHRYDIHLQPNPQQWPPHAFAFSASSLPPPHLPPSFGGLLQPFSTSALSRPRPPPSPQPCPLPRTARHHNRRFHRAPKSPNSGRRRRAQPGSQSASGRKCTWSRQMVFHPPFLPPFFECVAGD